MGQKGNHPETPHVSYAQIKSYMYNSITIHLWTKKLVDKKLIKFERKIAKLSDSFTH